MYSSFAIVSVVLGILGIYVSGIHKDNEQVISRSKQKTERDSRTTQSISSISLMKGALSNTAVGASYESSIYPLNYFDKKWNLEKNPNLSSKAELKGISTAQFKLQRAETSVEGVGQIFSGAKSQTESLSENGKVEILKVNRSVTFPAWAESVDVKATQDAPNKGTITTEARIFLTAPRPKGISLKVKAPGASSFTDNWGSASDPLPAGNYLIQVVGSGIIHYVTLTVDNDAKRAGIDPDTDAIVHQANNIFAKDVVIAEVPFNLTAVTDDTKSKLEECKVVSKTPEPSVESSGIDVSAKVFAVDGEEVNGFRIEKVLYVMRTKVQAKAAPGSCDGACKGNAIEEFFSLNPQDKAKFLDSLAKSSAASNHDMFDPVQTDRYRSQGGKGIVCTNVDAVAKAMLNENKEGPIAIYASDPKRFEKVLVESSHSINWYKYAPPTCERDFLSTRDTCGCFDAQTQITLADGTLRSVSKLQAGDWVWNPQTQRSYPIFSMTVGPEKAPMIRVETEAGTLTVTEGHPFLTERGLMKASDLTPADRIREGSDSRRILRLGSVMPEPSQLPIVWNLILGGEQGDDDDHYVLADGVMAGDLYLQKKLAQPKAFHP